MNGRSDTNGTNGGDQPQHGPTDGRTSGPLESKDTTIPLVDNSQPRDSEPYGWIRRSILRGVFPRKMDN